jgi:hypothetical protein
MAELVLEKKRSGRWWPFVAIIGVVAFLAWLWLSMGMNEERQTMSTAPPDEAPAQGAYAGTITDVGILTGTGDRKALIDRDVALEGVQVHQVVGDHAFLIGLGGEQRALVVRDPQTTPAPTGGAAKIDTGDTVAISGRVVAIPGDQETLARYDLDELRPAERAAMAVMVQAARVEETVDSNRAR